jgi:hypothetical protein
MYWFILKSILGSIIGSSFYNWFKNTRVGVWLQAHINRFMEYVAVKYDIKIAEREEAWLKEYPNLAERIRALEEASAPAKNSKV